jgi:hypothetical protein
MRHDIFLAKSFTKIRTNTNVLCSYRFKVFYASSLVIVILRLKSHVEAEYLLEHVLFKFFSRPLNKKLKIVDEFQFEVNFVPIYLAVSSLSSFY